MEFHDCFARDYAAARAKFRQSVLAAGGRLTRYRHPAERGPGGEALTVEVARFGAADAPKQLLAISGTHGIEGFSGSAAQIGWILGGGPRRLAADVGVVLVHALNPWGFAHLSRTTENNVDLNRNFIDRTDPPPVNPVYAELHRVLVPDDWNAATVRAGEAALDAFAEKNGKDLLFDSLARGQYCFPDGLNYGGLTPEWSNRLLEDIVAEHLATALKVGFIDWHTGIGEYGEPFFLCFNEEGGDLYERAARWWGEAEIKRARPHGRQRPNYSGLVFHGVERFLGGRPLCGAVVEFGTRGWHMRRMLRLDLWLKFKADPTSEAYAQFRSDLLDSFCPFDHRWREGTLAHAERIFAQALDGLAQW